MFSMSSFSEGKNAIIIFYLISILPCKILCRTLKMLLLQVIITKKFSSRTSTFLHEEETTSLLTITEIL